MPPHAGMNQALQAIRAKPQFPLCGIRLLPTLEKSARWSFLPAVVSDRPNPRTADQSAAQSPADGGLASAHKTNQNHRADMVSRKPIGRRRRTGFALMAPDLPKRFCTRQSDCFRIDCSTFLEVNFTTEGEQLNRRCGLAHRTCEGTSGSGNERRCVRVAEESRSPPVPARSERPLR